MATILMVGNSLTSANDMPATLAALIDANVSAITRGGARLAEFSNPKTKTGARVAGALAIDSIDVVVMQDMSHLAATNPAAHLRSVLAMSELARAHGATPVLYGTWGYRAGCPRLEKLGIDDVRMRELMSEGSRRAAEAAGIALVDTAAIVASMDDADGLYAPDGIHPSEAGSLLIARSIARAIQGKPMEGR